MNDSLKEKDSKITECTDLIGEKDGEIGSLTQQLEEYKSKPPPSPQSSLFKDLQQIEQLNTEITELQTKNAEISEKLEQKEKRIAKMGEVINDKEQ